MRLPERCGLVVFFAAMAALVTAACQDGRTPASPSASDAITNLNVSGSSSHSAASAGSSTQAASKVDVCHVEGNGSFHLIDVSANALSAHLAHGDAQPGDPVPGVREKKFDQECNQVDIQVSCPCWDDRSLPPPPADQCVNGLPDYLVASARGNDYILDVRRSLCYVKSADPAVRVDPTSITPAEADACLALLEPLCLVNVPVPPR